MNTIPRRNIGQAPADARTLHYFERACSCVQPRRDHNPQRMRGRELSLELYHQAVRVAWEIEHKLDGKEWHEPESQADMLESVRTYGKRMSTHINMDPDYVAPEREPLRIPPPKPPVQEREPYARRLKSAWTRKLEIRR